jgi:hypothetical protein
LCEDEYLGRLCILCERVRPNEALGGKGRHARFCRKCRQLPREQQDRLLHEREILGFLSQSHISHKNVTRLRTLAGSADARLAGLATLVRDVATVAPYRRRRIRTLAGQRRDLLKRMEVARLRLRVSVQPAKHQQAETAFQFAPLLHRTHPCHAMRVKRFPWSLRTMLWSNEALLVTFVARSSNRS